MNIADQCIQLFRQARASLLEAAKLLWQVREEGAFKGKYENFTEYVEEGVGMNQSQASRLLTTFEHFVIQGGVDISKLISIDPEKLYLSRKTSGTVETQIARAKTLSVRELKEERQELDGHQCEPVTLTFCKTCHKRLDNV